MRYDEQGRPVYEPHESPTPWRRGDAERFAREHSPDCRCTCCAMARKKPRPTERSVGPIGPRATCGGCGRIGVLVGGVLVDPTHGYPVPSVTSDGRWGPPTVGYPAHTCRKAGG